MPILLILDVVFGKYSNLCLGVTLDPIYVRNFLFVGIPYVMIGIPMRLFQGTINKVNANVYTLTMVVSIVLIYCVDYYMRRYGLTSLREHGLCTTVLSVCIFALTIRYKTTKEGFFAFLGRKFSLSIYIAHIYIGALLVSIAKALGCYHYYYYVAPLGVVVTSILFAHFYNTLLNGLNTTRE